MSQAYGQAGMTNAGGGTQDLKMAVGGGKTPGLKAYNSVIQVDPSGITDLVSSGAQDSENWYKQSLSYYTDAINKASTQLQAGYAQGNQTLTPLSQAGTQALNEMQRMLGLNATSQSAGLSDLVSAVNPEATSTLTKQMNAAQNLTDPTARAAAKAQIMDSFRSVMNQQVIDKLPGPRYSGPTGQDRVSEDNKAQYIHDLQFTGPGMSYDDAVNQANNDIKYAAGYDDMIAKLKAGGNTDINAAINDNIGALGAAPKVMSFEEAMSLVQANPSKYGAPLGYTQQGKNISEYTNAVENLLASQQSALDNYNSQVQSIKDTGGSISAQNQQLQQLSNQFDENYSTQGTGGYSGDQVMQKLSATPGYQFQMDAGTSAIARQGAATGMLGSGNTGAALMEFGQGLASNTYNTYMANLGNIANMGNTATGQISANQISLGQGLTQLTQGLGAAGMQTYQGIGDTIMQSDALQAQLRNQDAQFNAQLQYNSKQANLGRNTAVMQAGVAAAPGMMNAATNAGQFAYQQYAGAAAANAYGGGQMSGAWQQPSGMTQANLNMVNTGGMIV